MKTSQSLLSMPSLSSADIDFYNENGYLIVRDIFDSEEVEVIRKVAEEDPDVKDALSEIVDGNGNSWHAAVWTGVNDSLVSVVNRTTRIIDAVEAILGEECYHWHSKLVRKPPHDPGYVDWHQGHGYWYEDGCLFPSFVTCTISITPSTPANGCLQIIPKSHLMGRIEHIPTGNSTACDPSYIQAALKKLDVVDCEMNAGDAVFFHANTIHGSQANQTDKARVLMHCHYNAASNEPFKEGTEHHHYVPIQKLPDSAIKDGLYRKTFQAKPDNWDWYLDK